MNNKKRLLIIVAMVIAVMIAILLVKIITLIVDTNNRNDGNNNDSIETIEDKDNTNDLKDELVGNDIIDRTIVLIIDGIEVEVFWLANGAVNDLKRTINDSISISMKKYSTFEQVEKLGFSLKSDDEIINVNCGDIVLYEGNKIVILYDSNTYSHTKIGHINLRKSELGELLSEKDVITLRSK